MIACALRPSEALNSQWNEVDLNQKLLVIRDTRMKSAREHKVPLSTAAIAILKHQATVRTGDAVFPGLSGSPLSYNSFATAPIKAGIKAATPHGWRSVFRDWGWRHRQREAQSRRSRARPFARLDRSLVPQAHGG